MQSKLGRSFHKWLRKRFCQNRHRNYKIIRYRYFVSPEENSQRLIEHLTRDFDLISNRTDAQCLLFGRFMGFVLLLERKLVLLLKSFDEGIDEKMLGEKIDVFKDFLNRFEQDTGHATDDFRALIGPLTEIKKIRDTVAHDLSKVSIDAVELAQTEGFLKKKRADLYDQLSHVPDTETRNLCLVAYFSFVFSEQLAKLQCEVE